MDFIIDEAEVSDEIYSENFDCSDNESLLDYLLWSLKNKTLFFFLKKKTKKLCP